MVRSIDRRAGDNARGRRARTRRSAGLTRAGAACALATLAALIAIGAPPAMGAPPEPGALPAIAAVAQTQAQSQTAPATTEHQHHEHRPRDVQPQAPAAPPPANGSTPAVDPAGTRVEQIAPRAHVISYQSANLVVLADEEATFVAGVHHPPLVARARTLVQELGARPVRYALVMEDATSLPDGDGGWAEQGAVTFIHERLYGRMYAASHSMKRNQPPAIVLNHPSPKVGFSQVIQVLLKSEDVHVIHARAGYTDADVIVHFEGSGIVYLGNTFTTDGYPAIDAAQGGDVEGMLTTIEYFAARAVSFPETVAIIVPGRGPVAKGAGLTEFRDMLVATRDRVRALIKQGKTLADVVAAKPSASFDERWGRGPVTPDAFVTSLYKVLAPR